MKSPALISLLAGAALVQVGASPFPVATIETPQVISPFRYGHAVAHAKGQLNNGPVNGGYIITYSTRPPCKGVSTRLNENALKISNAFRKALGLPIIQNIERPEPGRVHILPFIPPPPHAHYRETQEVSDKPYPHPHHHHHHHHHHGDDGFRFYHRLARTSFLNRIHFALMALGPWEGRAVAFVLGCGIGVLLRMVWVLSVITFRTIKASNEDQHRYSPIFIVEEIQDAAEVVVPSSPPAYADVKPDKGTAE